MPPTLDPRANLDGPPPAATGVVKRVPDAPMAGTLGLGTTNPVSPVASIEDMLMRAMDVEIRARELATNIPEVAQAAAQFIDALRMAVQGRVQGGAMQQPPMQQPMAAQNPMMGMAAPQPAGLGAGAPPQMM